MTNDKIVQAWKKRSELLKDDKRSVMDQSFPRAVNDYIGKIHLREVLAEVNESTSRILDIGCGYGRVAEETTKLYPNVFIYGIDIAPLFVKLFNQRLKKHGKGFLGDMRKLPFKDDYFDYIYIVASFMYLEEKTDQEKGMRELMRVLKKDGKILFIEPNYLGVEIVRLFGLIPLLYRSFLKKKKLETYGIAFPWKRIDRLIEKAGGKILYKKGYPLFSLFILSTVILAKIAPFIAQKALFVFEIFDKKIKFSRTSYFITYAAKKL